LVFGVYACSGDGSEPFDAAPTTGDWIISDQDAVDPQETNTDPRQAPSGESTDTSLASEDDLVGSADGSMEKAGCTFIQFCDAPASFSEFGINWGTVCRVETSCDKFAASTASECDSDLRALGCSRHQPAVIAYRGEVL
jgi:hypothetical protein